MDNGTRLQEIVNAYLERDGSQEIDTGIVAAHIAQMKLFGVRMGVEFYPAQDNFGEQRKDFISRVAKYNKLDTRLDSLWDYFICDGKGLFYIRPTESNYRLYYFRKHEYRSYYNVDGELDQVVIIYSYRVKTGGVGFYGDVGMESLGGTINQAGFNSEVQGQKKYIRLSITRDTIEETHSDGEMSFDNPNTGFAPGKVKKFPNSLRFIPCVEIFNNPKGFAMEGTGDFEPFASQIAVHDQLAKTMRKNLQFFGSPTLLSSRPKSDLMEDGDATVQRPSIAANSGFRGLGPLSSSTRKADPVSRGADGQMRVPRVIANLEPNDRVGYIVPDAISGDQNSFVQRYREEIRIALGGVDELSVSAGATATEYKSLYGRVAATSKKKAEGIYTHGICRCMELIIFQEEQIFKDSLAMAAQIEKPLAPDEGADEETVALYNQALQMYEQQVQKLLMACVRAGMVPPGVRGLIPDGDITVEWRWLGPVYEETSQDILNNSIVVRNLQELGVDSIEALKYLFPSKTDEERAAMLSGFPFRLVERLQAAYSQFSSLVGGMMQTPHPQAPDLPMASDPKLDMTPYLYRTLEALQKEMSYAGRYRPFDPVDEPSTSGSSKQLRGSSTGGSPGTGSSGSGPGGDVLSPSSAPGGTSGTYQLPIRPVTIRPAIPGAAPGEPMGVGIQPGGGPTGDSGGLPVPGSVLATDLSNPTVYPGQLAVAGPQPVYGEIGSADLATKPDILLQLFPNLLSELTGRRGGRAGVESGKPSGGGSVRDRSSGDSKSVRAKSGRNARQRR